MDSTISLSTRSLQFYVIAKRWLSDVEFFKFEIDFFDHLMNVCYSKNLVFIDKDELARKLVSLRQLKKNVTGIEVLLADQLRELELMADDILLEGTQELTVKQIKLETMVKDLTNEFRELKRDIYNLAGQLIMELERVAS